MNELAKHFSTLELRQWRLAFRAASAGQLPDWLGSAWRGLFGHALREAVCQCEGPNSEGCTMRATCPYVALFEPRSRSEDSLLHSAQTAPAPYILIPEGGGPISADESLAVRLILFGAAKQYAGLSTRALIFGAMKGIGKDQISLASTSLSELSLDGSEQPQSLTELDTAVTSPKAPLSLLPQWPGRLRLEFVSPLRMRLRNRYVGPDDLNFGDLFAQLLRRASLLRAFHCTLATADESSPDFRQWVTDARQLDFADSQLTWHDLARHSSRQRRKVPMGGLVGHCIIEGEEFAPLWPLIWLGQWLGVGKGTTMGLGQYQCEAAG